MKTVEFVKQVRVLALSLGLILSGLVVVGTAGAASIQFSFTGTVLGSNLGLSPPFAIGQTMSGSFTVSPLTDSNPSANIARYNDQITGLTVTVGTATPYVATFAPTDNHITIRNLPAFDSARLVANTPTSGDMVNGFTLRSFDINLVDGTAAAFDSQYPTSVPSISAFSTTNQWRLIFTGGRVLQGSLTNLTAVPLPAAVILFGAGLVALVGLGAGSWRRKQQRLA
jgi:hypothetical protein